MELRSKLLKYARFVRFRPRKVAKWLTIYYSQNTSVVGTRVKELKDRVNQLSVIVETFTPKNENGSDEVIVKAAKGIEPDIKDLLR